MNPPARRNDPCPCGSARRYKDCHGRLAADDRPPEPPRIGALIDGALRMHRQGRIDEAGAIYLEILRREPAIATHYLGMVAWHRGDLAAAEAKLRASIEADGAIPDFHNNLGMLLRDTGRFGAAIACYRRTLEVDPAWIEAYSNLGLALESAGRFDEAIAAYREGLARAPDFAVAHHNLARALLTRGDFAEGWDHYRWRLAAQGLSNVAPAANEPRLAASLSGRSLVLHGEQGLGDELFFLRFAPELVRRGARLAYRGDARLHSMLARTGLFTLGLDAAGVPAPACDTLFIGDLPWLLEANGPTAFPPPLALIAMPDRLARLNAAARALGPAPRIGLAWRAGTIAAGPVRLQSKRLAPDAMAAPLRGRRATWISLQRLPGEGEREALAKLLEAPVHDWSGANDDLEEMLAALAVLDGYEGVSSANIHLGAGLGAAATVWIPHPPEWRWGLAASRSPWFPCIELVRQAADGAWPLHRG
jgi:hypothetical protein